ncbi:DUF2336 domain-containing protein [Rhizobium paknamense]|uniref:Uncharacterized protein (DUF2336 family) n=1 Tax=Rhizobium paknamense TaxID=1206817 RepID=A0ABU0I7W2_9HYPH|nr:DUF2336 domain-containing protein [Rhizobium paknamense]MDQ0454318.1 uncharacterized protein (DUF2336 family) [Rhizobium paknamense]
MEHQFRALENPRIGRKKDVVLMATVSSFDSLDHPARTDLRQFALLFQPLFQASSEEARREAVAALSQSPHVPAPVALFIASQPIAIAAPFLVSSPCLSDDLLITIARSQGRAHARAIVRREALSPAVIDALVGMRFIEAEKQAGQPFAFGPVEEEAAPTIAMPPEAALDMTELPERPVAIREDRKAAAKAKPERKPRRALNSAPESASPAADETERLRLEREEKLRQTIKALDRHLNRPDHDRLGARNLSPAQEALLVRFARAREAGPFATTLADALGSSRWLVERIMLDTSGRQLATALMALAMQISDIIHVLTRFFPHLSEREEGEPRIARLIASLNGRDCENRLEAWLRADAYTYQTGESQPTTPGAGNTRIKPASGRA